MMDTLPSEEDHHPTNRNKNSHHHHPQQLLPSVSNNHQHRYNNDDNMNNNANCIHRILQRHRMMMMTASNALRSLSVLLRRYCGVCWTSPHSSTTTPNHHRPPSHISATVMERMIDGFSDVLEMIVYWIGPLLIGLAVSIVGLLCYTFMIILVPMIYQKHMVQLDDWSLEGMPEDESYHWFYRFGQISRPYIVLTFHCSTVLLLVTNVLYNYACCVGQSHIGIHYDNVLQALALVTNTTLPQSSLELLSYRKQLSQRLTQRMKEQHRTTSMTSTRSTSTTSTNPSPMHTNHNHHHELTQRRTAPTTASDDPLMCTDTIPTTTTTTTTANANTLPSPPTNGNGTSQTPSSSTSSSPPTTVVRAWMVLGPYEWGYCSQSHQPKPPRSHYDHVTKQLILNLDHYCPWMFNAGT